MSVVYVVLALIVIGGIGFGVFKITGTFIKGKTGSSDQSENPAITTTEKIIPYQNIENFRADMGGYEYRLYFQIQGTNYMLLSGEGKKAMEQGFLRLLTSDLNVPVQYFTHTRKISSKDSLDSIHEQTQDVVAKFPDLTNLAEKYYDSFSKLNIANTDTGEPKTVKTYYAVVIYKPDLDIVNAKNVQTIVDNDLNNIANLMDQSFRGAGVPAKLMNKFEITELVDDVLTRSEISTGDILANGNYNTPVVTENSPSWITQSTTAEQITDILTRAKNEIQSDIYTNPLATDKDARIVKAITDIFEKLKNKIGGGQNNG